MKKIGITTYFDINNYGSALQAFAMREFLHQNGYEAEFLSVREQGKLDKLFHKLHVAAVSALKCVFYKEARDTQREIIRLKRETSSVIAEETRTRFENFRRSHLPSCTIGRRALKKKAATDAYGAFVCGSDQIWSPLSAHLSGFKFLNFAPRAKRIAYAPSFGVGNIPAYNRAFVKRQLSAIDDISVRETAGAQIVKTLIGRDVPTVLDPTMLLTGDNWRTLYDKNTDFLRTDRYALCYFFDEPSPETVQAISAFTKREGLNMVVLFPSNETFIQNGAECVNAGPWEFLSLIDHAEYVFTNSFHGCVFSVLFNKRFVAFGRHHSETVKQTSRITTLLETVGASDSFCEDTAFPFVFPDVALFDKAIDAQRTKSRAYLLNCLEKRKTL